MTSGWNSERTTYERGSAMKKTMKSARGRKFETGTEVRSLRERDDGATGTIVRCSRKQKEWEYTVLFDGWYRAAVRLENELEKLA